MPDHNAGVEGSSVGERGAIPTEKVGTARVVDDRGMSARAGSRWRMRNWRLRTKLIAVLVVPTVAVLVLGGLQVKADLDRAERFRQTVAQVDLARKLTNVVHELQTERSLMSGWVAGNKAAPRTEIDHQTARVDKAVDEARGAAANLDADEDSKQRYNRGLQRLSALPAIRATAEGSSYPDVSVYATYSQILDALVQLGREVNTAVTDRELLRQGTLVQALSEQKEFFSRENAMLMIAATRGVFPGDLLTQTRAAEASAEATRLAFAASASPEQQRLYADTVSGVEVDNRARLKATAFARAEAAAPNTPGSPLALAPEAVKTDGTATVERLRKVETGLLDSLRRAADGLASDATLSAWRNAGIVAGVLIVALILMIIVTRSLLRPLRTLRRNALDVANRRLPETVRRILDDPDPMEASKNAIEPVPVFTREETGEVARSFDVVHEQAVRMAAEQALLRENVNSIFVNLSRRSQALVERQLNLIDRMEQDEQDPDQLASLFELDHLATRMRRNSESLLVLSGSGLSRQLTKPVPAADVVGAAVSEVEQYARVDVVSAPDVAVMGRAVNDLVHLIAELLDNATSFSDPDKKVTVRMAATKSRELAIQITDRGVGMSDEDIAGANARLADPPDLDVSVTRRMGLYVVARLAKRHDIKVRLRDNEDIEGGLVARITVPAVLVQATGAPTTTFPPGPPTSGGPPSRASGIAGAFTGNMPKLGADGTPVDDAANRWPDYPPPEVVGYPPADAEPTQVVGHGANGVAGGWGEEKATNDATADGPASLFGEPLPERQPGQHLSDAFGPRTGGAEEAPAGHEPVQAPQHDSAATNGSELEHRSAAQQEVDLNVDAPTERLPIYEAVLSQWFEHTSDPKEALSPAMSDLTPTGRDEPEPPAESDAAAEERRAAEAAAAWQSPGDDGWQAAQALLTPDPEVEKTTAGLPKRVPKAHLVPGSAAPRQETAQQTEERPQLPPRTADAVRGRMSSFQQGVRRGRHALVESYPGDQSGSAEGRQDEEQE
ncbi:signal transduction histidine kinase [Herbihabitans rhizosphaerae]|uniref:histidine kinase n=1 Tax=Herbihabitans rhizosphaerae TaxID=1872711 RepID=A0A4Q7KWH5_9PSEU|nr:nitrate- and nitrite sensing domain-containing protein [Herbihabitans rhizosphaerae]RZS41045.1 signal transduction histidine kinase [Herbihabitans rhizosphaerae]